MRNLLIVGLLLAAGCTENAAPVQVGPATMPALPAELVKIEIAPGAVRLAVEPGAVRIDAQPPAVPEDLFDRLWLWVGIAAVAGVAGYWVNRWVRLAVMRVRRPAR